MQEASPELVAYIRQELENGFTKDEILAELEKSDWDSEIVSISLLEAVSSPTLTPQNSGFIEAHHNTKPDTKKFFYITVAVILIIISLGLGYLYNRRNLVSEAEQADSLLKQDMQIDTPLDSGISYTETSNQAVDYNQSESSEGPSDGLSEDEAYWQIQEIFIENLSSCVTHSETFTHPLTGDALTREIVGFDPNDASICVYKEQMPNNGLMTCRYTESQRQLAAVYYEDILTADSYGTSIHSELKPDGDQTDVKYYIDDQEVSNPLQTFMENGVCVITGY